MILVCGGALIDMVPEGDVYRPCPGGGVCNTAVAIGRLGVPVKFLAKLSTDFFGDILVKRLTDNNIGLDYVVRNAKHSTLAFVKLEKGKEPQYVFFTDNSADRSLADTDVPASLPPDLNCIVFGDIAMTMEPVASTIEKFIFREHKNGKAVISFDPNIRPLMIADKASYINRFEKWIAASDITKISEADYEYIYPNLSLDECIEKTLSLGPHLAVVTLGDKGVTAVLRRDNGTVRKTIPNKKIEVVDTIGAGDTFHGAFLSYLEIHGKMSPAALAAMSGEDLDKALMFANAAAALVCTRKGAEPPTLKETENAL
ncbi:MAG: carbohydrate kinase [Termitinemataceae bacterium]|nr:MAG: carbohydrate kinase [Termitinemataceae bacterium]